MRVSRKAFRQTNSLHDAIACNSVKLTGRTALELQGASMVP